MVSKSKVEYREGKGAAKRFTSLVKRVIKTPKSEVDRRAKAWKEAKSSKSSS